MRESPVIVMPSPTPIVDRVLWDPLDIPAGVDDWLRSIEREAREVLAKVEAAAADQPIPRLKAVMQDLQQCLDETSGELQRLVRRSLSQLTMCGPAAKSFERYIKHLSESAAQAILLQQHVSELRTCAADLRERFGTLLPYSTRRFFDEAGLSETNIANLRHLSQVESLEGRLRQTELMLQDICRDIPSFPAPHPFELYDSEHGKVALPELQALLDRRLGRRRQGESLKKIRRELRSLSAAHLHHMGDAGNWNPSASQPWHFVANRMAIDSMGQEVAAAVSTTDTDVWTGLLGAASAGLNHPQHADGWHTRIIARDERSSQPPAGTSVFFVVPIDSEFWVISQEHSSPVRVWSRRVELGKTVDCRLFGIPDVPVSEEEAAEEIAPLFNGLDGEGPAWYMAKSDARLAIIGRSGSVWFARLQRRGTIQRIAEPAFKPTSDLAGAVRVVGRLRNLRAGKVLSVEPTGSADSKISGIISRPVRLPLQDYPEGLLRIADAAAPFGAEAVLREQTLFRELGRHAPGLAPRPLGRGQTLGDVAPGNVYASVSALRADDMPALVDWMRCDRLAFARAVADLLATIHRAGYALGVYHPAVIAYRVRFCSHDGRVLPEAIPLFAPFATRLGEPFPVPERMGLESVRRYPRLRFTGFPPFLEQKAVAMPELDAIGFGLFLLDMLATEPLLRSRSLTRWDALAEHVEQSAEGHYDAPGAAIQLATWVVEGDVNNLMDLARTMAEEARR